MDNEVGIPNLDDCTENERSGYGGYEGVFYSLASYCHLKSRACRYREKGKIALAVKLEAQCQAIYTELPAWARW